METLREIYLGFSGSSSSKLRCKKRWLKYSLCVVRMVRKEISVYRFSKTEGLWQVQVDCPLCIWLWIVFSSVLQVKNTQKSSRTGPIAKSTKLLFYFLKKFKRSLQCSKLFVLTSQTLISLAGKGRVTWLPCFHRCFLTHHYFVVDRKPEEEEKGGSISHVIFQRISSTASGNIATYLEYQHLNQIWCLCLHWIALYSATRPTKMLESC